MISAGQCRLFPKKRELFLTIAEVYLDVQVIYKEICYFQSNSILENHEVNIKTNKLEQNQIFIWVTIDICHQSIHDV